MSRPISKKVDQGQALRDRADQRAGKKVSYKGESNFVNYTLDDSERQHLKALQYGVSEYDDILVKLLEEEYAVSISYDDYSSAFMCLLRPKFTDNVNAGYLLSGRGSTPLKAVRQVAYIHWSVFDRDWGAHYQAKGKPEIDD